MEPSPVSKADKASADRSQLIVRFYDPDVKAKDAQNRTLEEILSWPDSRLESSHNYIQMLFPLPEGSMFNWDAPVIDLAVMEAFLSRNELRQQLRLSFERMLSFYGFQVSTEFMLPFGSDGNAPAYKIIRTPNWRTRFRNWAVLFNHNHLRITRILRCLRVLGLQRESTAFFAALESEFENPGIKISENSMRFWRLAVTRPLHWAPDDEKCKWLEAWERQQEHSEKSADAHDDVQDQQDNGSKA